MLKNFIRTALAILLLAKFSVSLAVPYAQPNSNSTSTSWEYDLPSDGTLYFGDLILPQGVGARFQGSATRIILNAEGSIRIDGALDAGPRALTLNAPSISFGPNFFLTGSGTEFSINAAQFDGGPNFNPRGDVFLNGQRLSTGPTLPGENFGAVIITTYVPPLVTVLIDTPTSIDYFTPDLTFLPFVLNVSEPPAMALLLTAGLLLPVCSALGRRRRGGIVDQHG